MAAKTKTPQPTYVRFTVAQRVEHLTMLLSFATLGLTGLLQKYGTFTFSARVISLFGGVENLRIIHHTAALVMMLGTAYHIVIVGYKTYVERRRMTMLPGLQDLKDAITAFLYNLGFQKSRPQMGRYTFEEKAEYWAFVWGTIVMGMTGFMMWNPITATKLLPGDLIPAAKAAHGGEALLAVLAIIVWHMYGVHIKHFNKAMWTGRMTEEEMLHEHPLELADIKAGEAERPVDPVAMAKRRRKYIPVATALTVAMLIGVYIFVASENTALTTIPPQAEQVVVFVPQTPTIIPSAIPTFTPTPRPPTPTLMPGQPTYTPAPVTWTIDIGPLFASKCIGCHGTSGGLNLTTYADALKGGVSGPIFISGDPRNSLIINKFLSGAHPYAGFTLDELALLEAWILGGGAE